jgi:hypothetical protein
MTAVTKVEFPSLEIMVNQPPILSIELLHTLNRLIVTLDIEFSNTAQFFNIRKRIANIIRPLQPEIGVLCLYNNQVMVSQCSKQELLEFVHTVQVPVQALHTAGFLTDEHVEKITNFVYCNILRPSKSKLK